MRMRIGFLQALLLALTMLITSAQSATAENAGERLADWLQGVWITGSGTFTVYTADHYFVISAEGDSASPNIYCGASQLKFCSKGMARKQTLRLRQVPSGEQTAWHEDIFTSEGSEVEFKIDTTLFQPGICNTVEGVIYDSITETTDEYILLATCNGDQIKVFASGVYVYLPKGGGEYKSYRVEKF